MTENKIVLSDFMHKPEAIARFADLLGGEKSAQAYVESVLILVAGDENLKTCTPMSIYIAAKRAASLGLSCDKSLKQAWIIPYPRKVKATKDNPEHWIREAQFQPHYKGLHTLAVRTNKYYIINVGPVYEGQRVLENQITGLHVVIQPDGLVTEPEVYSRAYAIPNQYAEWRDVTVRRDHDQKVIGWLAYFETKQGFKKSVYMSCEEIEQHARIHVPGYLDDQGKIKNPNWGDTNKRPVMEMKTVFRQLMGWADLTGKENEKLAEALKVDEQPEIVDAETEPESVGMTYDQAKQITVKGKGGKEKFIGELDAESLNAILTSDKFSPEQKEAARVVLQHDFNMEPPAETKSQKAAQAVKDLGF